MGTRDIGHLLRRAGFGPSGEDVDVFSSLGFERAVDRLIDGLSQPPVPDPPGFNTYQPGAITSGWMERMRSSKTPLAEKLALFWHGHFATSLRKVDDPRLMWRQVSMLRALGGGKFATLVSAVSRDPAMIRWLDGNSNRKGAPNENYARELMELFTIGRSNYSERDVREAARAFTGWGAETTGFVLRAEYHDSGSKTFLGETGDFDGDDVVRILTKRAECARFIVRKLIAYFSHPEPAESEVQAAALVFSRTGGSIGDVVRQILLAPGFRSPSAYRALIKSPAEYVVGSIKVVGLPVVPPWTVEVPGRMGQTLFAPPTVKGWDGGRAWLAAGSMLERIRFAERLAPSVRDVDAMILLGFDGVPSPAISSVIDRAAGHDRVALALASPEFQLN